MRIIKNIVIGILVASLLLAICRAFNYDPFGIIDWVVNAVVYAVNRLTDIIFNNPLFQGIFGKK